MAYHNTTDFAVFNILDLWLPTPWGSQTKSQSCPLQPLPQGNLKLHYNIFMLCFGTTTTAPLSAPKSHPKPTGEDDHDSSGKANVGPKTASHNQ